MQAKKNRRRLVLLVALTLVTLFVFWWIQPENRLNIDHDAFIVEDLSTIDRVDLASGAGRVSLNFDGNSWRVNDQYKADADMIRVLFATLQQARPKRTVPRHQKDSILRAMEESGVEVSLHAGQDLQKRFLAGGNVLKTQAFFADPASGEVYVMTIPGYRVYVAGILELPESGWRDKFVFGFNWRNFKRLEAKFPENPADNFTVSMDRNHFGIAGLPEADTTRLNNFLDAVSLLTVNAFVPEPGLIDSLKRETPLMEIAVTDVGNRTYALRLFDPGPQSEVPGLLQDSQAALFDKRKIELLLRPRSFFKKK